MRNFLKINYTEVLCLFLKSEISNKIIPKTS
jgi:hypothetical protein